MCSFLIMLCSKSSRKWCPSLTWFLCYNSFSLVEAGEIQYNSHKYYSSNVACSWNLYEMSCQKKQYRYMALKRVWNSWMYFPDTTQKHHFHTKRHILHASRLTNHIFLWMQHHVQMYCLISMDYHLQLSPCLFANTIICNSNEVKSSSWLPWSMLAVWPGFCGSWLL